MQCPHGYYQFDLAEQHATVFASRIKKTQINENPGHVW